MNLTKSTIIEWTSMEANYNDSITVEREAKIAEWVSLGLTDGIPIVISYTKTQRNWLDQEAAQAFIDFVSSLADKYTPGAIISATIVDV